MRITFIAAIGLTSLHIGSFAESQTPRTTGPVDPGISDASSPRPKTYRFVQFFRRFKEAVTANWKPAPIVRAADPTGRRYGTRARVTELAIELAADGSLVRCRIKTMSGIPVLDNHAVAAVLASQPFTAPPPQLLNSEGRVSFTFKLVLDGPAAATPIRESAKTHPDAGP